MLIKNVNQIIIMEVVNKKQLRLNRFQVARLAPEKSYPQIGSKPILNIIASRFWPISLKSILYFLVVITYRQIGWSRFEIDLKVSCI